MWRSIDIGCAMSVVSCRRWMSRLSTALFVLAAAPGARAESVSEEDVVRLAMRHGGATAASRAEIAVAAAEERQVGVGPDPSASWTREHVPDAGAASREDTFAVELPVDLSGRRRARQGLARAGTLRARARAAVAERDAALAAVVLFYEALGAEQRAVIALAAVTRIEEAARVLGRRHEEGTASGYERARLEVEVELARSDLRQAEASARLARTELGGRLGLDPTRLRLAGRLSPVPAANRAGNPRTPASALLDAAAAAAADAGRVRLAWLPSIALTAGLRVTGDQDARTGYVAGIAFELPVFSRGSGVRAEAEARAGHLAAEARAESQAATLAATGARAALAAALAELAAFEAAISGRVDLLARAAQASYREGARPLAELVDAQRAVTDVDLRRLELELAARRADVQLRAAEGGLR